MNELLWFASRSTGVVSIAMLTIVVVLGLRTSGGRRPHRDAATVGMALHRNLSLGTVVFLVVHVATAIAETYVEIDAVSAVVPFTSPFERVPVGLGTLAVDLLLTVTVTSLVRHRLSMVAWRRIHLLSHLLWPTAVVHGLLLGTAKEPVLRAITIGCAAVLAVVLLWRLRSSHADRDRRRAIGAQEWS